MSRRVIFFICLLPTVFLLTVSVQAQQVKRIPHVGYLSTQSPASGYLAARLKGFQQGLRELGYVEGRNIIVEHRSAEGKLDRLPNLAAELVRMKVDVIVVAGDASIRAAKQATSTIPIIVANAGDLVGPGYAASLARPGRNITGLVDISPELGTKRLDLLKEALPKVFRVAVLWNPTNPVKVDDFKQTQVAAQSLGLQIQSVEVRAPNDFEPAFSAIRKDHVGALLLLPDGLVNSHELQIADFVKKNRLPAMHAEASFANAGGLMTYGPSYPDLYRRAAYFVDKILKGAKPADLPVEQPTKFELVINLKAAKQIGLTIPQSVLYRADKVIK